jgi:hypothetical protein
MLAAIGTMAALLLCTNTYAQNDKLGTWNIVNVNLVLKKKFTFFFEAQTRSQQVFNDFFYRELKGGLLYKLPNKNSVFVGFGDYRTYEYPGEFKNRTIKEHRLWEQFTLTNNVDIFKIEHRYRIEQRWVNGAFSNRFRYRINPLVPINKKVIEPGALFLAMFDEVFFTDKQPYFLRNRFFGGAGFQFSKYFTLQAGVLRQFDYRISDGGSAKSYLHLSFIFTTEELLKDNHPSTMD